MKTKLLRQYRANPRNISSRVLLVAMWRYATTFIPPWKIANMALGGVIIFTAQWWVPALVNAP